MTPLRIFRALIGAVFLGLIGGAAVAQTSLFDLRNSLVSFVLDQISIEGVFEIRAQSIEAPQDGAITLRGVQVADKDGVWLTAPAFSIRWDASRILSGELEINELTLTKPHMTRAPAAPEVSVKQDAQIAADPLSSLFDWPRAPLALKVEHVAIENARIDAGAVAQGSLAFSAQVSAQDEGAIQALSLEITREDDVSGQISVNYRRDFDANTLALSLNAKEAAGGLTTEMLGLPNESASEVSLEADGPLNDWRLTLNAHTQQVLTTELTGALHAQAPFSLQAQGRMIPGERLSEAARAALGGGATLALDILENDAGEVIVREGALRSNALNASFQGAFEREAQRLNGAFLVNAAPELAALAHGIAFKGASIEGAVSGALNDLRITGAARMEGFKSAGLDIGAFQLVLDVTRQDGVLSGGANGFAEALRADKLSAELLGRAEVAIEGAYQPQAGGRARLSLASEVVKADAHAEVNLQARTMQVDYDLSTADVGPFAAAYDLQMAGSAQASGGVQGAFGALALNGTARVGGMRFKAMELGAADFQYSADIANTIEGALDVSASGGELGPASAKARYELAERRMELSFLSAEALGLTLQGEGAFDLSARLFDGTAKLAAPDLGASEHLKQLTQAEAAGEAFLEAVFLAKSGAQAVKADGRVRNFKLAGFEMRKASLIVDGADLQEAPIVSAKLSASQTRAAGAQVESIDAAAQLDALKQLRFDVSARGASAKAVSLENLLAQGRIDDPFEAPQITATLSLSQASAGPAQISAATLALKGPLDALKADLDGRGELENIGPFSLAAAALADLQGGAPQVSLNMFDALVDGGRFALNAPLQIILARGAKMSGLDLSLPGGQLTGAAALFGNAVQGGLSLTMLNVEPMADLLDAPRLQGPLTASLKFDTTAKAYGELSVTSNGLTLPEAETNIPLKVSIEGGWNGAAATLKAQAQGGFERPFAASARLPMRRPRAGEGPAPIIEPNAPMAARLTWSGQIEPLWAYVPAPDHLLSGLVDLDLKLSGPLSAPQPSGSLRLREGRYEFLETGTILTNLQAQTKIDQIDAFVLKLNADDGAKGAVEAQLRFMKGDIEGRATVRQAVLARRDDIAAALSADLKISGSQMAPAITGEATIESAEIRLIADTPPSVADLGDVRFDTDPPKSPQPKRAHKGGPLDIKIRTPGNIFIRGRGLSSEWRADLRISGQSSAPRLSGVVESVRGRLDFLGQPFKLTKGLISFQNKQKIDPALDVSLERARADVTGRIEVGGFASEPQIIFASTPALPQDEILPRIIFGRSAQDLSPAQAVQLASGVATLLSGEEGVLGEVRGALGLDVLSVQSGEEGSSVRAGRNVAEGVFVGVDQPIDGRGPAVEVEVELFDGVTVDSKASSQGGASLGVNWKRDF